MNPKELKVLKDVATDLTGNIYDTNGHERFSAIIEGFMAKHHVSSAKEMLLRMRDDLLFYKDFISQVTNHTTRWMREAKNLEFLVNQFDYKRQVPINICSIGCSTGEEVYSLAIMLYHRLLEERSQRKFYIVGYDIDELSINYALKAVYSAKKIYDEVDRKYHGYFEFNGEFARVSKKIRDCCTFLNKNALERSITNPADIILIRNLLIYFTMDDCKQLLNHCSNLLKKGGFLVVGVNEDLSNIRFFKKVQSGVYCKPSINKQKADLVLVGSSIGGIPTVKKILDKLTKDSPPFIIVQHISGNFGSSLIDELRTTTSINVVAVNKREKLQKGNVYLTGDHHHLQLVQREQELYVDCKDVKDEKYFPSIDLLFLSAAKIKNKNIVAGLLSGMGSDGVKGMEKLFKNDVDTFVQDEKSSLVYGMAKRASQLGYVKKELEVNDLVSMLQEC